MIDGKYQLLLADDSPDDLLFMRRALALSPRLVVVGEVGDGQEAIDYLKGEAPFSDRQAYPIPDAVLLDLKMPRKNGFDVLEWIKDESLPNLVAIVVSGSWLSEDVKHSQALGADGYFKKTTVRAEQADMVREIEALLAKRLPFA